MTKYSKPFTSPTNPPKKRFTPLRPQILTSLLTNILKILTINKSKTNSTTKDKTFINKLLSVGPNICPAVNSPSNVIFDNTKFKINANTTFP